jgi:hypothetical protein
MRFCNRISNITKTSVFVMFLLFTSIAARRALAQTIPLVYNVEDTCASQPQPVFPAFSALPTIDPLPDPFVFMNGSGRDTSFANWEHHRCDFKAAIENYEIGPKPPASDVTVTASWKAASSTNGTLTVVVTRKSNSKSLTITSNIYFPALTGGPYPAVISMALSAASGPDTGSIPSTVFTGSNIATVEFLHNQVAVYASDATSHTSDPFYLMYPELCAGTCTGNSNSGTYAAWSWGVSRLIDGLYIAAANSTPANPFPIDLTHLASNGCSYAGKMALFAGAFDERVALTIAQENGGGGMPSWRASDDLNAAGTVEDIDDTNYSWFGQQMQQFDGANVNKLPEDHHELSAMVLPRALLSTGNTDYTWLSNESEYVSGMATEQIYRTFGIGDRLGIYIDGGHAHCGTLAAETPIFQAFVDKFQLGQTSADTNVLVNPYPTEDYARWTSWWGTANPVLPAVGSDFLVIATQSTVSVAQGSSTTSAITVSPSGGFTGTVSFTATGMPNGVTASFSPASSASSSVLTLTASSAATAGTSTVIVKGTSGSITASTPVTLTVTGGVVTPTFTLASSPSSLSVTQGSSATDTISVTDVDGFSGAVSFSATGMPSGVTASFSPTSSATSSVLTLTASSTATTGGPVTVTVTGISGSTTATTTIALTVNPLVTSGFTLSPSASTMAVTQGSSGTDTITVTDTGGFTGSVAFTASGMPSGVTAAFNPTSSATSSVLTLTASSTATTGAFTITVTGTSGTTATTTFTLNVSTSSLDIDAGGAASGSWVADKDYSGGTALTYTNAVTTSLLTGTVPPSTVLQSQRYGNGSSFTYTIPGYTSGSSHTVTLYFVENYVTGTGKREFNVLINGTQVLTNYDVYAAAGGQFKAVEKSFTTTANSSGQLVIQFSPGAIQNPMVSGIAIQ